MAGGSSVKKKYALVSWKIVCKSKDQGGLGLLHLDLMNIALRAKWWIRFKDPNVQGIWKSILLDILQPQARLVNFHPSGMIYFKIRI